MKEAWKGERDNRIRGYSLWLFVIIVIGAMMATSSC